MRRPRHKKARPPSAWMPPFAETFGFSKRFIKFDTIQPGVKAEVSLAIDSPRNNGRFVGHLGAPSEHTAGFRGIMCPRRFQSAKLGLEEMPR